MTFGRELALWAVLGAVIAGVSLRVQSQRADPSDAPVAQPDAPDAPARAAARPARDCPEVDPALEERLAALEAEAADLALSTALIEGQNVAARGAALAWPTPTPPGLEPAAVKAALDALVADAGGVVAELDCGEYPCVALVLTKGRDALERIQAVSDGLREGDYPDLRAINGLSSD